MKFVKKNRYTIILILVFVLLVCLGVKVKDILMPDDQKEAYGNRLNDIEKHSIADSLYAKIKSEIEGKDLVTTVTNRIQGKIINFIVLVDDKMSVEDAKKIGDAIIEYFTKDELSYYTIQIYINKNDESLNNFPIIGAKNPLTAKIVWTQDREITKKEAQDEK